MAIAKGAGRPGAGKHSVDQLAILGGQPLFSDAKPIGQLAAPDVEEFLRTFRISYDARHLSNDGPLVRQLETELAELHGVRHCIALANAGLGIMMILQLLGRGRSGEVIMPAFSYRGLPHFAQWAGHTPRFCDVDADTHALCSRSVAAAISERTVCVLAVANFNHSGDLDALCRLARDRGISIVLDSVYGIGSSYGGRTLGSFADAEIYSLHATKLLNGFEGGYITTDDDELATVLRWQRNFCLPGLKPSLPLDDSYLIGCNAKLNEMHAAMALLSVRDIEKTIARNRSRYERYAGGLKGVTGLHLVPYPKEERANYQMAVVEVTASWPLSRDQTVALLRAEGAAISAYYSPPLHLSEHCPTGLDISDLPIAQELARRYVQLPVGDLVSEEDIDALCALLRTVQTQGASLARRLVSMGLR